MSIQPSTARRKWGGGRGGGGIAPTGRRAHRITPDAPEGVALDARAEAIEDVAEAHATPDEPERVTHDVPGGELRGGQGDREDRPYITPTFYEAQVCRQ